MPMTAPEKSVAKKNGTNNSRERRTRFGAFLVKPVSSSGSGGELFGAWDVMEGLSARGSENLNYFKSNVI
tara:strand:- start:29080 stop:29289 length:210 start_codon:yes stop_codon:yes gene_type:complete